MVVVDCTSFYDAYTHLGTPMDTARDHLQNCTIKTCLLHENTRDLNSWFIFLQGSHSKPLNYASRPHFVTFVNQLNGGERHTQIAQGLPGSRLKVCKNHGVPGDCVILNLPLALSFDTYIPGPEFDFCNLS